MSDCEYFFRVSERKSSPGSYSVEFQFNAGVVTEGDFEFDPDGDIALECLLDFADPEAAPEWSKLEGLGDLLWFGLASKEVRTEFDKARRRFGAGLIRLAVPRYMYSKTTNEHLAIPWETILYAPEANFDQQKGWNLVHQPDLPPDDDCQDSHEVTPVPGKARMLVLAPKNIGLNTSTEVNCIRQAIKKLDPENILFIPPPLENLTPTKVQDYLQQQSWDIVHYIGHGEANENGELHLIFDDDGVGTVPMRIAVFSSLVAGANPRLVVINCCHSETGKFTRPLTGFGPLLLQKRVPAVVTMRYAVPNGIASRFSEKFYEEFLASRNGGRLTNALARARITLAITTMRERERDPVLPVAYLVRGYEQLFQFRVQQNVPMTEPEPCIKLPDTSAELDQLFEVIKKDKCVVICGPGIYSESVLRLVSGAEVHGESGPYSLAKNFVRQDYPRKDQDFGLCEQAGGWLDAHLFHWISQHTSDGRRGRGELIESLEKKFSGIPIPKPCVSLAEWPLRAVFYTHFDGFLERCVEDQKSSLQMVHYAVDKPLAGSAKGVTSPRSLVLLRGSYKAIRYLVLTEHDYDRLERSIHNIDPQIEALARATNRSVAFIGVSPRDPLVRLLAHKLLDTDESPIQGPAFFLTAKHDSADEAYWRKYNVVWVSMSPCMAIEVISKKLRSVAALPTK